MSLGSYFFQKRRTKMLEQLKKEVYEANMELPRRGLITYTWGNVSGRDAETGYFVIKPSGVDYDALTPDDMVVMDLDGNKISLLLIQRHISSCTKNTPKSAVSYIHIHPKQSHGHRQAEIFRCMARPTQTISLDRSPAPEI